MLSIGKTWLPVVFVSMWGAAPSLGQTAGEEDATVVQPLATKQAMILDRVARLEDQMFRLREKLSEVEPENARKLGEALQRIGELELKTKVAALSDSLRAANRLETTAEEQEALISDLESVLDVLLDRDPNDARRREELRRLAEIKENLDRIIREQTEQRERSVQAIRAARLGRQVDAAIERLNDLLRRQSELAERTGESSDAPDNEAQAGEQEQLASEAERLAEDVSKLAEQADSQEPSGDENQEGESTKEGLEDAADSMKGGAEDMKRASGELREGQKEKAAEVQEEAEKKLERALHRLEEAKRELEEKAAAGGAAEEQRKLADDAGKLSQKMQGDQGGRQNEGQQGQQQEGQQQGGQQQQRQSPGQPNVQQAERHMRRAAEELDEPDAEEAIEEQNKALDELERAQMDLEEALKQLRQEEQEELLRSLDARVEEMLTRQTAINNQTLPLHELGVENFTRAESNKCAALSEEQAEQGEAADACVRLLEEDGTTVVFPNVMRQLSADMDKVAQRLREQNVGVITISMQKDMIVTLQQLSEALKKLREKMEKSQAAGGGGGGGAGLEPPLVPTSAELKLLKSSQVQINNQTLTADTAKKDGEESAEDINTLLQRAAERQAEVAAMAREIQQRAEKGHGG